MYPPPQKNPQAAANYLRSRVMTATPEQLHMMLFDGAVRFAEQGRAALKAKNFEKSYHDISRTQKIVNELHCSLKPEVSPELCKNLAGIYVYIYKKLIDANTQHSIEAMDEAIKLIKYQRETWSMLLEKLGQQKAAAKATTIDMPAPDQRMEASLRMSA